MYDFDKVKERTIAILDSKTPIEDKSSIPSSDSEFTYENGIRSWVTAIFIDINKSSELFKNKKDEIVSRTIRSFSSEIINILKSNQNYREIGIRGDCVFGIYSTPYQKDVKDVFELAIDINTFLKMHYMILKNKGFPTLSAGIGIGCSQELIIKAGLKQSGINDLVWIGDAVVDASNLSGRANRNGQEPILISDCVYSNIIELLNAEYGESRVSSWFVKLNFENIYGSNVHYTNYEEWLK